MMWFSQRKRGEANIDERLFEANRVLEATVRQLETEVSELQKILHNREIYIAKLEEVVSTQKDALIDIRTKLFTHLYYEKYIKPVLRDDHVVFTVSVMNHTREQFVARAEHILNFSSSREVAPVLWAPQTVKIFLMAACNVRQHEKLREHFNALIAIENNSTDVRYRMNTVATDQDLLWKPV